MMELWLTIQVTLMNNDDVLVNTTCPGGEFIVLEVALFVKGVQELTVFFNGLNGTTITMGTV